MTQTIEEVKKVALDNGAFVSIECVTYSLKDGEIVLTKAQLQAFAQHYIEVGRKMQRDSDDAAVANVPVLVTGNHGYTALKVQEMCMEAIRNNTGE